MMKTVAWRFVPVVLALVLAAGCAAPDSGRSANSTALRVGVTPDYPPLVFMEDGQITGVEVDLALQLGKELGRDVEFLPVPWRDQIDALVSGKTDIIMSGMSKTKARSLKVAFSETYIKSGLRGLCRQADEARYDTPEKIKSSAAAIGVIAGTTADTFVQKYCPRARRYAVAQRKDALFNLKSRDIDLFLDDGFAIADLYAENEAQLAILTMPLTTEEMGWAVRTDDPALLAAVNGALAKWKADGTLRKAFTTWMPYLERYVPGALP
jgi:ABC-type amino acid transport substrate-binding protein